MTPHQLLAAGLEGDDARSCSSSSWRGNMKLPSVPIWYGNLDTCWNFQFGSLVISVYKPRHWNSAGLFEVWRDYDIDREY